MFGWIAVGIAVIVRPLGIGFPGTVYHPPSLRFRLRQRLQWTRRRTSRRTSWHDIRLRQSYGATREGGADWLAPRRRNIGRAESQRPMGRAYSPHFFTASLILGRWPRLI
jgi:hypothetical protein